MVGPGPDDEDRHAPGTHVLWEESWRLDFATADGALGGYVRLGLLPNQGRSWVWACLVGDGRRLLTVVEHEAPLPRAGALDLRCEGLWTDLVCETPLAHWSVGLEAFGVALDEPADAYRGLRGERVGLGFDLEWETSDVISGDAGGSGAGYVVPCAVHGEVLVGAETIAFDGWGTRHHAWGTADWWAQRWTSAAGRLDDATRWHVAPSGPTAGATGTVTAPGGVAATTSAARTHDDGGDHADGLPTWATVGVGDLALRLEPRHAAPVPLHAPDGREGRLAQALCRTTASDGRTGSAWAAWNQPSP